VALSACERKGGPPDSGFDTLVKQSMSELEDKASATMHFFRLDLAEWGLDQSTGVITFTAPDGVKATAPAQIIGTYNSDDRSWLWAWDNPSVTDRVKAHSQKVRYYGENHGIAELTTPKLHITEKRAWELTALGCKLNECQGTYRGPAGKTFAFITFGKLELTKTE
jgi:hypothetical protein